MDNNLKSINSTLSNLVIKIPSNINKDKHKNVNKTEIGTPSEFKHMQHFGITKANEFEV